MCAEYSAKFLPQELYRSYRAQCDVCTAEHGPSKAWLRLLRAMLLKRSRTDPCVLHRASVRPAIELDTSGILKTLLYLRVSSHLARHIAQDTATQVQILPLVR